MPIELPRDIPIDLFEHRNKATCHYCGDTIYWIWIDDLHRCMPYDILTRSPHPQCFYKSNFRKYKYKK